SQIQFPAHYANSFNKVAQFLPGGPAGGLAQAAIGGQREPLGWSEFEAAPHALSDILRRLEIITLHVDNTDGDIMPLADFSKNLQLGKFAAGHFEVDFVHGKIKESRKHGPVGAGADRAPLVIAETEVSRETGLSGNWLDGAVENL